MSSNTDNGSAESYAVLQQVQEQIEKSRQDYQRASQVSTLFHSTSKWVLGVLAQNGWLYGRKIIAISNLNNNQQQAEANKAAATITTTMQSKKKEETRSQRRPTRLLEIGAINTELLDASTVNDNATATHNTCDSDEDDDSSVHEEHGGSSVGAMLKNRPIAQIRKQGGGGGDNGRLLQVRAIDIHSSKFYCHYFECFS
jgi:hypothetical protein